MINVHTLPTSNLKKELDVPVGPFKNFSQKNQIDESNITISSIFRANIYICKNEKKSAEMRLVNDFSLCIIILWFGIFKR